MLYQDKYVAFIDMLGFSALVQESAADMSKLDEIAEAIDRLKNTACCNPATGLLFTYFSDCIVISSSRSPAGLADILSCIRMLAENLLVVDILIRGGLTVGSIHHDSQMIFGPVNDCYIDIHSFKVRGGLQSAEARPNDHNLMTISGGLDHGSTP